MDNPNNHSSAEEEAKPVTPVEEAKPVVPVEEEAELDTEEDFDDSEERWTEIPDVIQAMLKNPPLLPNESKEEFERVFEDFLDPLDPETISQHWLVWNSAIYTWEVMRHRRLKIAYILNQRRMAVSVLIRKAFSTPPMLEIRNDDGSDIEDNVNRYFKDPAYQAAVTQALVKAGYTIDAVDTEMFSRSLGDLARFERLIASAEKQLTLFFRETEKIHGARAVRAKAIADAQAAEARAVADDHVRLRLQTIIKAATGKAA